MSIINQWYGWTPDRPDARDWKFVRKLRRLSSLPRQFDWSSSPFMPPIDSQGDLGACTAFALAALIRFLERRKGDPDADLSELFIYYNERVAEGTVDSDSGAMLRTGIKTLADVGACSEALWKYDIAKFKVQPPEECYTDAVARKALEYRRVDNTSLAELLEAVTLAPVVGGFTVYEGFESGKVTKTGVASMPKRRERVVGGHAILVVGYDMDRRVFIVRNSWGADWGMRGYFTIPFEYFTSRNLADDFQLITLTS